jgi:glutamate 5-kinase
MEKEKLLKNAKRIVVKIGSQLLSKDTEIDEDFIKQLSEQISKLKKEGKEVILVSSGAVLAGVKKLKLKEKPKTITEKQAVSAVGQAYLMQIYDKLFSKENLIIGQVLLTIEGLRERKRYNYARNTLNKLLEIGVVPIINENDTIAVEEIVFGDNDFLAAHVSVLVQANLLIVLSTAGGLYTDEPSKKEAKLIEEIKEIDEVLNFAKSSKSKFGTGGMRSKLEAAKIAVSHSIPVVIAPRKENILIDIIEGKKVGSFLYPQKEKKISSKKSWLALLSMAKGKIIIDEGAEKALRSGKSLLPAGIVDVEGIFYPKDVVVIENQKGEIIGKGIVNYNYKEVKKYKGLKSSQLKEKPAEVIHRDNLVIF